MDSSTLPTEESKSNKEEPSSNDVNTLVDLSVPFTNSFQTSLKEGLPADVLTKKVDCPVSPPKIKQIVSAVIEEATKSKSPSKDFVANSTKVEESTGVFMPFNKKLFDQNSAQSVAVEKLDSNIPQQEVALTKEPTVAVKEPVTSFPKIPTTGGDENQEVEKFEETTSQMPDLDTSVTSLEIVEEPMLTIEEEVKLCPKLETAKTEDTEVKQEKLEVEKQPQVQPAVVSLKPRSRSSSRSSNSSIPAPKRVKPQRSKRPLPSKNVAHVSVNLQIDF